MHPLEPPDTHYLMHAVGWLELGSVSEAKAELAHIRTAFQFHPDVLEVRWLICAEERQWPLPFFGADQPAHFQHVRVELKRSPDVSQFGLGLRDAAQFKPANGMHQVMSVGRLERVHRCKGSRPGGSVNSA